MLLEVQGVPEPGAHLGEALLDALEVALEARQAAPVAQGRRRDDSGGEGQHQDQTDPGGRLAEAEERAQNQGGSPARNEEGHGAHSQAHAQAGAQGPIAASKGAAKGGVGIARAHGQTLAAGEWASVGEGVMHDVEGHPQSGLTLFLGVVVDFFIFQSVAQVGVV